MVIDNSSNKKKIMIEKYKLLTILMIALAMGISSCELDRDILADISEANEPPAGLGTKESSQNVIEGEVAELIITSSKTLLSDHTFNLVDTTGRGGFILEDENGSTGPFTMKKGEKSVRLLFSFPDDNTWTPVSEKDTIVLKPVDLEGTHAFIVEERVGSEKKGNVTHPSNKMIKTEITPSPPTVNMAIPSVVFTEDDDYTIRLEMSKTSAEEGSVDLVPTFVSEKAKVNDYTTNAFPIDANGVITVTIPKGVDFIDVPLVTSDALREYNDIIRFEITNPIKANLGTNRTTEITIYDDDRSRESATVNVKSDGAVNGTEKYAISNEGTSSLGISRRDERLSDAYPTDNRWVYMNYDFPAGLDKSRIEYARISLTSARVGKAQGDVLDPLGVQSITMGVYTVPDEYDGWDFNSQDFHFKAQMYWEEGDKISTFEFQDYMDPETKAEPFTTDEIDVKLAVEADGNDILSLKIFPDDDTNNGLRMFFEGEGSGDRSVLYLQWFTNDPEE
jgi:hypothetical protein